MTPVSRLVTLHDGGREDVIVSSLVLGVLLAAVSGVPQGEVQPRYPASVETDAARIFNSTMSPFCPGLLIANCPSPGAADLKDRIRAELAAGVTPDSVRALLVAVYGVEVQATPPASGFGLLAWVMPGLVLLGGAVGLGVWLRRRGAPPAPPAPGPGLDPAAEARLEEELARL